jgi:hypothetical protein
VLLEQDLAGGDDVLGLGAVQADGADVAGQLVHAQGQYLRGVLATGYSLRVALLTADVGRLRRQQHGDQQLERRRVFELGFGEGWRRGSA